MFPQFRAANPIPSRLPLGRGCFIAHPQDLLLILDRIPDENASREGKSGTKPETTSSGLTHVAM